MAQGNSRPSQEINIIQEAVRTAIASEMLLQSRTDTSEQCRAELDALRHEFTRQMVEVKDTIKEGFRDVNAKIESGNRDLDHKIREAKEQLYAQGTEQALIQQRLDRNDAEEQEEARLKAMQARRDNSPLSNRRLRDNERDRPSDKYPPYAPPLVAPNTDDSKPLIPPKIMNAIIIAVAAGMGGTVWHLIEKSIWPTPKHEHAIVAPLTPDKPEALTTAP